MGFVKGVHLAALAVWIGSMTFFSFVVAPVVFKNFPRETAGDFVGYIFPKYYPLCLGAGAVALATLLAVGLGGSRAAVAKAVLIALMLGLQGYDGYVIRPKAVAAKQEIRAAGEADDARLEPLRRRFGVLHRNAMILNSIVILLGYAAIVLTGYRL